VLKSGAKILFLKMCVSCTFITFIGKYLSEVSSWFLACRLLLDHSITAAGMIILLKDVVEVLVLVHYCVLFGCAFFSIFWDSSV